MNMGWISVSFEGRQLAFENIGSLFSWEEKSRVKSGENFRLSGHTKISKKNGGKYENSVLTYDIDGNDLSAPLLEIERSYESLISFVVEEITIHEVISSSGQMNGELSKEQISVLSRINAEYTWSIISG